MTPLAWLVQHPSDEVLVHEIGHTFTGLALGIPEHGIEFLQPGSREVARSRYSRLNVAPELELPRILAGMYCQARLRQGTVNEMLRGHLVDLSLFAKLANLEEDGPFRNTMAQHGFDGDWTMFLSLLATNYGRSRRLRVSQAAHKTVATLFDQRDFGRVIPAVVRDMQIWLQTPDETFEPIVCGPTYPISRIRSVAG